MATVTLLSLKSTMFDFINELYQGTATGGGSGAGGTSLIDSSLIGFTSEVWPAKLEGLQLRVTAGATSGDLRMVGTIDRTSGTLYPNRNFTAAVANTDTYELWGTAINGASPLTNLFNMVIRDLKPITDTQVTIVTGQRQYDVSSVVQSRRDIHGVYIRLLDPNNLEPYRIQELRSGIDWWAYDRGGAGTTGVTLELMRALTLNTTQHQLWLRGETSFTAFSSDTSTVDAVYRDWLAWEAVLELSRRKLSMGTQDKARWQGLQARAIEELSSHRPRWLAGHEPIEISTFQGTERPAYHQRYGWYR